MEDRENQNDYTRQLLSVSFTEADYCILPSPPDVPNRSVFVQSRSGSASRTRARFGALRIGAKARDGRGRNSPPIVSPGKLFPRLLSVLFLEMSSRDSQLSSTRRKLVAAGGCGEKRRFPLTPQSLRSRGHTMLPIFVIPVSNRMYDTDRLECASAGTSRCTTHRSCQMVESRRSRCEAA